MSEFLSGFGYYSDCMEFAAKQRKEARVRAEERIREEREREEKRIRRERGIYEAKCAQIYSHLAMANLVYEGRVGIQVRSDAIGGEGLILREALKEEKYPGGPQRIKGFIVTPKVVYKIGPLKPRTLEKVEKPDVDYRLGRLVIECGPGVGQDILEINDPRDADRFQEVMNRSLEKARKNTNPLAAVVNILRWQPRLS